MAVNVTHLRSFWAVASCGGFSAAARWLRVSQPTLTRQIRELEEGYGVVLFERNAASTALTPEGQALFPIASRMFEAAQEAEHFLKQYRQQSVRLAAVTTDVTTRLVSAIQSFTPDLRIAVSVGTSKFVYDALVSRRCDIGLLTMPDADPMFSCIEVGRYPLLAVLPKGHAFAQAEAVGIADLANDPIIVGSQATQSRHHLDRAARALGVTLDIAQEIDGYEMIGELVRLGLGVGVIGYTGIVERNLPDIVPIRECLEAIPVHFACLALNRRIRTIDHLYNIVKSALVEGAISPVRFAGARETS